MRAIRLAIALLVGLSPAFPWGKRAHGHLANAAWRAWANPARSLLDERIIREAAETTDGHPDYPPQDHVFYPETFFGFTGGAVQAAERAQQNAREAFLSGDYRGASEHLGRLAHIISDISQPFHTSRDGATSRNPGHSEMDSFSNDFFERAAPGAVAVIAPAPQTMDELARRVAQEALAHFPEANASPTNGALLERLGGLGTSAIISAWDLAIPPQAGPPVARAPLQSQTQPAPAESGRAVPVPSRQSEEGKTLVPLPTPSAGTFADADGREAFYAFFGIKPRLVPVPSRKAVVKPSPSPGVARAVLATGGTEKSAEVVATRANNHSQVSLGGIPLEPGATYRLRLITSPVGHAVLEVVRQ